MTDVLIKKGTFEHRDRHTGRMPCEDEGRDGGDVAEVRELQRLPAKQQKLGERHGADPPWQPSEEISTANSFILDFQPLEQ